MENKVNYKEKVIQSISKQLKKKVEDIKLTSRIVEDLGADSLDVVELLMSLEESLGIRISDEVAFGFKTVGDIVGYVEKNIQ